MTNTNFSVKMSGHREYRHAHAIHIDIVCNIHGVAKILPA